MSSAVQNRLWVNLSLAKRREKVPDPSRWRPNFARRIPLEVGGCGGLLEAAVEPHLVHDGSSVIDLLVVRNQPLAFFEPEKRYF